MTLSVCDQVAERVALGEPLGALSEHAASCAGCRGLVAMSSQLGAVHHAVDPGPGFAARMTVGAQHRLAVRRRRKLAVGLAATVAGGMFGVFLVTRAPEGPAMPPPSFALPKQPEPTHSREAPTAAEDADLAALVQLADVDHNRRLSARWSHIKKPLAPYKRLLTTLKGQGETP